MEIINDTPRFFPKHIPDPQIEVYLKHHVNHLFKCIENELFPIAYCQVTRAGGKHHNIAIGSVCRKLLARIFIILKECRPDVIQDC